VVDGGYVNADASVTSQSTYTVEVYGPVPLENRWQAKTAHGFDLSHAPRSNGTVRRSPALRDNAVVRGRTAGIALDKRSSTSRLPLLTVW
jgi:hypothetical protein